jgi:hypothetical protein
VGLRGFIVMMGAGIPVYANVTGTVLDADPSLVKNFLLAIQALARQLSVSSGIEIKEMLVNNLKVLYRSIDNTTFIGMFDQRDSLKNSEPVMEGIISTFLALYRDKIKGDQAFTPSMFFKFDDIVEKLRTISEKDILRWAEKSFTSTLHGILNKLVNFFPITDLIKINPNVLKNVGRHMIWISRELSANEEAAIYNELKESTSRVYGPGMLESIEQDVKAIMGKFHDNM